MNHGYNINSSYYIQLDLEGVRINGKELINLEKNIEQVKIQFLQDSVHEVNAQDKNGNYIYDEQGNIKTQWKNRYYYCVEYPTISNTTKRVCYMKFKEYTKNY